MLEVLVEVRRDAMRAELSMLGRARGGEGRASAAVRATNGLAALEKLEGVQKNKENEASPLLGHVARPDARRPALGGALCGVVGRKVERRRVGRSRVARAVLVLLRAIGGCVRIARDGGAEGSEVDGAGSAAVAAGAEAAGVAVLVDCVPNSASPGYRSPYRSSYSSAIWVAERWGDEEVERGSEGLGRVSACPAEQVKVYTVL